MNIRSLTRGDGVVIGAAVLLFIASFLNTFKCDGSSCGDVPNAWQNGALFLGMYLAGIIGAALIVLSRALPQPRKIAGLDMRQFGTAFTVFAAWTSLGAIFDPAGPLNAVGSLSAGSGLILGLIAAVALAAAAVATPFVPILKAGLIGAPRPAAPQPYGGGQPSAVAGYGYPGGQQPGQPQPYGTPQSQPQAYGGTPQGGAQAPQSQQGAPAPAGDFAPFWFAVPVSRQLYTEDGSSTPVAELAPGHWYLAVEQRGSGLVAQTQDNRRGVLRDTSGIQRG